MWERERNQEKEREKEVVGGGGGSAPVEHLIPVGAVSGASSP